MIQEARQALLKHKHIILQSPTGSGKGVLIGSMSSMSKYKVLILAHSEEILTQDAGHAKKWGIESACVFAKTRKFPTDRCCAMMVQTLRQRIKKPEWEAWFHTFGFIILDECHRAEFDFLFDVEGVDGTFVVGLSASPARYGQMRQLGLDYGAVVMGPQVSELVRDGYLCRCRLFSLDAPSLDGVDWSYSTGDFNTAQMAARFKSPARYVGAVENYMRICPGEKCLVFCCSSEQTIEVTKAFCDRGIDARYCLSGSFDEDEEYSGERKDVVEAFARGDFLVLVNFGLFTTGIDIPDIKVVMLMFSTTSLVKYLQCLGRASRIADGKNGEFICLDFGRNHERLGRYEDDRIWSVWHKQSAGGGVAPTKECPHCGRLIPVSWTDCQFCGYHFPSRQETYVAELQEIVSKEQSEETLEQMVARKKLAGWKNDWILRDVCQKNPSNMKESFMKAVDILRTAHGEKISPKYWHFFKEHKLGRLKADDGQKKIW